MPWPCQFGSAEYPPACPGAYGKKISRKVSDGALEEDRAREGCRQVLGELPPPVRRYITLPVTSSRTAYEVCMRAANTRFVARHAVAKEAVAPNYTDNEV